MYIRKEIWDNSGVVSILMNTVMGVELFILKRGLFSRNIGIHPLVRFVAAMCMLKYGDSADHLDEHLRMSETSLILSMKYFC